MKILKPKKLSYYPLYIFFAWIIIWIAAIILSLIGILLNTTPDGKLVWLLEKSYYYVLVQEKIKNMILKTGIETGVITILVGYSFMLLSWSKKKRPKRR